MENTGVALYRTTVAEVSGKKDQVNLPNGRVEWVGSGLLHKDVGILIINIGDLETEHTLLDPLAKSIAQFCRLLVPDDQIRSIRVRSMAELQKFWSKNQEAYSHVVWIGHGSETGITFAVDGLKDAAAFVTDLRIYGASKKTYISLCCKTGYQSFGAPVSEAPICKYFIGPFHSVEGAVASQFCQTFLTSHFLNGKSAGVAFKHARESVPGSASFRLWNSGKLKAGPRK
ncbi:MAG: hypothetical protein HY273_01690 [Gammaproteobacteria bacterium]|nr:hypothetical protein [Gammaproteobacteria bacterium]